MEQKHQKEATGKKRNYFSLLIFIASLIVLCIIGKNILEKQDLVTPATEIQATSTVTTSVSTTTLTETTYQPVIHSPKGDIKVLIASTSDEQTHGLSDRPSLPTDEGMLFVFTEPKVQSFWMKNMNFFIDMIWIDKKFNVVGVTSNVSPDTYPNIFLSPSPVTYVLEVNAGYAEKLGIKKDITLEFAP